MPPIKRTAGIALDRSVETAQVHGADANALVPADTLKVDGTLPPEKDTGADKVIGRERSAPQTPARGRGARNASFGLSLMENIRARIRRSTVVALLGIGVLGGLGDALAANAGVVTQNANPRVTHALAIDTALKATPSNTGSAPPPPPPPPLPRALRLPLEEFSTDTVPSALKTPGRDAAVVLARPDGTTHDVRMPRMDLPARLIERDGFVVEHGDDPGDYYCEHALFVQQHFAFEMGIAKNQHGESLTGFLHVPDDEHSNKPADATIDAAARYARHREVIGAAVFGFFHDAKKSTDDDIRILITGYGPFMGITNNPAGGFVSDAANLDAAALHAFGDALVSKAGVLQPDRAGATDAESMTLAYDVKDGDRVRRVLITGERLDVADHELRQDDAGSLVGAMRSVRPHAMLSLGVHGGTSFKVEHHADDGGLAIASDGVMTHDGSKQPSQAFLDNYALARAILQKTNAATVPAPRV